MIFVVLLKLLCTILFLLHVLVLNYLISFQQYESGESLSNASVHTYCTDNYCDLFRVRICALVFTFTLLSAHCRQAVVSTGL